MDLVPIVEEQSRKIRAVLTEIPKIRARMVFSVFDIGVEIAAPLQGRITPFLLADISQLTFKSMAIVSTLHRHGNSIPFAALR